MSVSPSNSTTPSILALVPPNLPRIVTAPLPPVDELRFGEEATRRFRTAEEKLQDAETRRYECEHCAYVPFVLDLDILSSFHRRLSEKFAKQAALNEHLKSHTQTPVQQTEQLSVKMARWRNTA